MKYFLPLFIIVSLVSSAHASSFRILTIKSDKSTFAKQFFAGFSSSTPEKVIAFDYFGENGRVLSRKVKEINPDLVLTIGELPIFSSVSDFPSIPFLISNFQASSLENRNNVILINHSISTAQKISMLTYLFPDIKTVGTIYDPLYSASEFENFATAATKQGLKVLSIKVSSEKEVGSFVQGFKEKIDAFYYISDNTTGDDNVAKTLYEFLAQNNIPSLSSKYSHADMGALITIAPDPIALGEKTWRHAHQILQEGKISKRTIFLNEDEYVLSVSLSACDQFNIDEKAMLSFTKQATMEKGWKVFWKK